MGKHSPRYAKRRWWLKYTPQRLVRVFEQLVCQRQTNVEIHVHYHFHGKQPMF